uniref:C2H2-type domain-containing protein n=1 Tax=Timema genevievae TaxID=629358 RepID=A0A7R9JNP0_TIMGE|nr:unnamed protein product [Timema genevievae]
MNKEFAGHSIDGLAPSSTKLQGISRNTITSSELGQGVAAPYPVEQDGTRRYTDINYRSLGNDGLSSLQADVGIGRPADSGLIQMTYQAIDDMNTENKQSLQNIPEECEHIDGNIVGASLPTQKTSKHVEPTLEGSKEKEPLTNTSLSQDCQHLEENPSEVTLSPIEDYSKTNSIISPCVPERDLTLNEQEVLEHSANNRVEERKGNIVFHQSAKESLSTTEEHTVHNFETLFNEHSSDSAKTNFATGTPSSSVLECPSIGTEDQSPGYSGNQSVLSNQNTDKIPSEETHIWPVVVESNMPILDSTQIVIVTEDDEDNTGQIGIENTTPCHETNAVAVPISPEMPCLEPFTLPENVVAICNESDFEMPILNVSENASLVGEFVRHRSSRHPRTKEQHHCLLCQRTFPTLQRHQLHLSGHLHRHLETAQRRTIHTLFRLFTGNDCPALTPLSEEEASGVSWFPAEGGAIHFYHQAPPLQIAVQEGFNVDGVHPHLHKWIVENHPWCTWPGLNPEFPIFGSLVYCESALDHVDTKVI